MSEGENRIDGSDATELIKVIKREFDGVDRPVTASELARLYGVIAAQHEANLATFQMALEANPRLVFSDSTRQGQTAMHAALQSLTDALRDLALASMSDDDRAKAEADDGST